MNDVSLLLTKAQIENIRSSFLDNILSQDSAGTQQDGEDKNGDDHPGAEVTEVLKSMRKASKFTTRDVLTELLNKESDNTG